MVTTSREVYLTKKKFLLILNEFFFYTPRKLPDSRGFWDLIACNTIITLNFTLRLICSHFSKSMKNYDNKRRESTLTFTWNRQKFSTVENLISVMTEAKTMHKVIQNKILAFFARPLNHFNKHNRKTLPTSCTYIGTHFTHLCLPRTKAW